MKEVRFLSNGTMMEIGEFEDLEANPEALPEGMNPEETIIATYYVSFPKGISPQTIGKAFAVEQSTGTWTPVPEEKPEMRKKHVAKLVGAYEIPDYEVQIPDEVEDRDYILQIAYPEINIGEKISTLLSTVVGNISMGGKVKLLDLRFPKKYVDGFKGPQFGIQGVRDILGVEERPLVNNMIKPNTGIPPETGAKLAYEAAKGGVDIIKDDELMSDRPFSPLEDRVTETMESIKKADEEKGEKTLYAVEITDDLPAALENADKAIEAGANCLLINYLAVGFPVVRQICEDESIDVPIMGHMDCAGAYYRDPWSGIRSDLIFGKLPRLAGLDMMIFPSPYGKATVRESKHIESAKAMRYPLYDIKQMFPMPSGGIQPSMIPETIEKLGKEIIIAAGAGIHAHPEGPTAGGKAFRQAIDAVMGGTMDLETYVEQNDVPELEAALEVW